MKVVVCTSITPFQWGGAELLAHSLAERIAALGHEVELLEIPFESCSHRILDQILAYRLFDFTGTTDRVIAIRFPSYVVRHPRKIVWFIHHHRAAYDLWSTPYGDLDPTPEGLALREAIRRVDRLALTEATRVFANSRTVARRLLDFNGIEAQVLYPPLPQADLYYCSQYADYLLYVARFTPHKRQLLAIEALRHTLSPVRLVLAGRPDPGAEDYTALLREKVREYGLDRRVTILDNGVSDREKADLLAACLAAVYVAYEEDSYGFFTLEAQHARKAVITTQDAGGVTELVVDGVNGRVVPAEPEALGRAMDELYRSRHSAQELGEAGFMRIQQLGLSWESVLDQLLA